MSKTLLHIWVKSPGISFSWWKQALPSIMSRVSSGLGGVASSTSFVRWANNFDLSVLARNPSAVPILYGTGVSGYVTSSLKSSWMPWFWHLMNSWNAMLPCCWNCTTLFFTVLTWHVLFMSPSVFRFRRLMGSKKLHPGTKRLAMNASFASLPAFSARRTSFWTSRDAAAPDETINSCSWLSVANGFKKLPTASTALATCFSLLRISLGRTSWCCVSDVDPDSMSAMLKVALTYWDRAWVVRIQRWYAP